MKKLVVIVIIFFTGLSNIYSQTFPELVIESGHAVILPAQTHIFSRIEIKQNATLVIEQHSATWCILYCLGEVKIQGTIEYRWFKSGTSTYTALTPDGVNLTHTFSQTNKGGNGGKGGVSVCGTCSTCFALGGNGGNGNQLDGGGGGAGGTFETSDHCEGIGIGNNASGRNGGLQSSGLNNGTGGNGQVREIYGNGGLIYIHCETTFNGLGGTIDVHGMPGSNGGSGNNQRWPLGPSGAGGGGGGGGAPGNEGGKIIIRVKGNATFYPAMNVSGGKGGSGGSGGRGCNSRPDIPTSNGSPGEDGEDGQSGLVEIRH